MRSDTDNNASIILVTGAARRVGAEIARTLHTAGATVILHYQHSGDEAHELVGTFNAARPDSAWAIQGDLCAPHTPSGLIEAIHHRHQRLDCVVNNASSFFPTPIGTIDDAAWDNLIGSNLKGPLFLSQAAAPLLSASHGCIVNIVDIHAERPLRNYAVYCTAKAGLLGLTRALAVDLAPHVRVNGIAPGAIRWPEDGQFSTTERDIIIEQTLLKCGGNATDIAQTARFLIFDAPYITGQIIAVDGGRSAYL